MIGWRLPDFEHRRALCGRLPQRTQRTNLQHHIWTRQHLGQLRMLGVLRRAVETLRDFP